MMPGDSNPRKALITAVISGILSAGFAISTAQGDENTSKMQSHAGGKVECYGVNSCKGKGECGGKGRSCGGTNSCKGKGFLMIEKSKCMKMKGGRLTDPEFEKKAKT